MGESTLTTQKNVLVDSLGICEYCGTLLTLTDVPVDAMNAEWRCVECNGVLTHKSFGYEKVGDKWKKIQWVGEDGKWTQDRPIGGFELSDWFVTITAPPPIFRHITT